MTINKESAPMHNEVNEVQILKAQLTEAEALIAFLRDRAAALDYEVRVRDERIEGLESLIVQQDEAERTAS